MKRTFLLLGLFVTFAIPSGLWAQQTGYFQTNLVSNTAGAGATTTDPQLLNPWGISIFPGQDFWIANNNSGTSTLYDSSGNKDTGLVVTIPGATKNPNGNCSPGCPTGNVSNSNGTNFGGGQFIFDTEDGLIASWTGASNTAAVAFDNSASGAVYKGLAVLNGNTLLAANFHSGKVDVFTSTFTATSLSGSFTDPKLPAGYAPHGIHVINNQVYVAYAMQDAAKHDAMPGAGVGQVDIFDMNGNFVSTFVAAGGQLNAPWGVVATPATFGAFPSAILVGNFGDGTINAFDTTGKFLGQLTDASNKVLVNPGLWDMVFGGGGPSGAPGTLYLTAGGSNQPNFPAGGSTTSVFASVMPAAAATGQNFSLSLSAQSVTITPGGSANLMISAAGVGGFNSPISLSCSSISGVTCAFNPTTITPGSTTPATLTISAASAPPPQGYHMAALVGLLPALGLFGTVFTTRKRKPLTRKGTLLARIFGMLLVISMFSLWAVGCGSGGASSGQSSQTSATPLTMTVTGTSGAITQSAAVTITIN
ncbi:MAG TPA: TIGR03118 family protein [Candidatus Acidoferrales bacterium]|nr:TIGR03118 family protein [Candidatus Acidoferrales bacterium]